MKESERKKWLLTKFQRDVDRFNDFNLFDCFLNEPDYLVAISDYERVYITWDVDKELGVVRWIVEYYDHSTPEDNMMAALTFGIDKQPSLSDIDWMLRECIANMCIDAEPDSDEWCEFYNSIEFIPWERRHNAA